MAIIEKAMKSQRNLSVDIIKFIAAFGVVIIHLAPSTAASDLLTQLFLAFAVPFFLLISLYFFIGKVVVASADQVFKISRWDRIMVPYFVWTIIYILMRLMKFRLVGKDIEINVIGSIFYGGGAVQLYFLPLLLLFQAQALSMILLFRSARWRLIGICVALAAVVFGYVGSSRGYFGFQGALKLGTVYVAMSFLLGWTQITVIGRQINVMIGWLIFPLIACTVFLGYPLSALGILQRPIIGYGVSALALNWSFHSSSPVLRSLLTCSYGIFLAHFGFLECFEFMADQFGLALIPYSVVTKILMGGLICLSCVLFIVLARLHWLSAYLFLGESTVSDIVKKFQHCKE